MPTEVSPPRTAAEMPAVVLEGYLTKQGSRSSKFHDRYFVLTADGVLSYYDNKDEPKPKAELVLNQLPDCEISELYLAKQKTHLLYCVKVTWSAAYGNSTEDSGGVPASENDSVASAGSMEDADQELPAEGLTPDTNNVESTPKKKKGSVLKSHRKRLSKAWQSSKTEREFHDNQNQDGQQEVQRRNSLSRRSFKMDKSNGTKNNNGELASMLNRRQSSASNLLALASSDEQDGPNRVRIPATVEIESEELKESDIPSTLVNRKSVESEELEYLHSQFWAMEREKKRNNKKKVAEGAKLAVAAGAAVGIAVLTVGIGLVAGMVALGVGAAAGASGTATGVVWKKKKEGVIVLGATDYEKMKRWKACLDASLNSGIIQKSKWGHLFTGDGKKRKMLIGPKGFDPLFVGKSGGESVVSNFKMSPRDGSPLFEVAAGARWIPLEGGWTSFLGTGPQGLRIFREQERIPDEVGHGRRRMLLRGSSVDGRPCPPMKSHLVLNATPLDAFLCLMFQGQLPDNSALSGPLAPNSGQRASFRIIEHIDDNTDVVHLVCNPIYLFPSWTTPRDFVLYRYWRLEPDGSFIICFESVQHKDCPPYPSYCRGEMDQVFTIAPHKKTQRRKGASNKDHLQECLMTAVVQVDPKGWVPIAPLTFLSDQGYGDAFAVAALMQLLDVRDAIDQDRFIPVSLDEPTAKAAVTNSAKVMDQKLAKMASNDSVTSEEGQQEQDLLNYDFTFCDREKARPEDPTGLASNPLPLMLEGWAEPDANSFFVRGKTYQEDRKKTNAGASIGRLVAVDVVQVDAPIYSGMTLHPSERFQLALKKENSLKAKGLDSDMPPFLFVVNIVLPGPPFHHGVFYYAIDNMSNIDGTNGSPSSLLCKEFIFGNNDSFRDKTFKLIPQIVQGNFIVKKAVGSTPAIMGQKLRQLYVKTDRSFEVILDCCSSPVATGVIRLSLGYAKTLVVDMGFLLEGKDDIHLPERLIGCARVRNLDFSTAMRKVEQPPSSSPILSPVSEK